jgi:hypothetical protein
MRVDILLLNKKDCGLTVKIVLIITGFLIITIIIPIMAYHELYFFLFVGEKFNTCHFSHLKTNIYENSNIYIIC